MVLYLGQYAYREFRVGGRNGDNYQIFCWDVFALLLLLLLGGG